MRGRPFGWWRVATQVLGRAVAGVSSGLSTLVAADSTPPADGSPTAITGTWVDTDGEAMAGVAWTAAIGSEVNVDAAACTVTILESEIPDDGTTPANIELYVYDTETGLPMQGIPASLISFASDRGATDTITEVDTATNRNGRFRATMTSETAGNPVITATVNGIVVTDTATTEVTGDAPVLPTPEFASSFSNSTGQTSAALRDGTKWTSLTGDTGATSNGEVVASTGLGFPTGMTNVLLVKGTSTRDGLIIPRKTGLAVPDIGETKNYRWYMRVDLPDSLTDNEQHPVQDGNNAGDTNWMFKVLTPTTTYYPRLHCQGGTNFRFNGPTLAKETVYRYELQIVRTGTTTFRAHMAVFTVDGTLVASDEDFVSDLSPNPTLADSPTFTFVNVANMDGLNCGSNGIGNSPPWPFTQGYQGGFYVCDNQLAEGAFIGAFQAGEDA